MGKYYGVIGYATGDSVEYPAGSGLWVNQIIERPYYGDVIQNSRRLEGQAKINDDINIGNKISIVADPYAYNNIYQMKYIVWQNVKWKVTSVDVQEPRLVLSIGGVYNG